MTGSDADSNLVYGILALQLGFIDRDDLVEAMHNWVVDRRKPLGEILLGRGRLSPEEHTQLASLVSRHSRLRDDDPRRSLAGLGSLGSVREVLERIADTELTASLARVGTRFDGLATGTDGLSTGLA